MKKAKRVLSVFLALLMIVSIVPMSGITASAASSGTCGENLTWTFDESTGTLTISGTGEMYNYLDEARAPWLSDYYNDIETVIIEDGVTTIGDYTFYCCYNLKNLVFPDNITYIGDYAFSDCYCLKEFVIPHGVSTICFYSFRSCTNLAKITIPDSVTTIEYGAFNDCQNLTDVYFAGSEDGWKYITTEDDNAPLTSATMHYEKENAIKGDVDGNGRVTATDGRHLLEHILGKETLAATYVAAADVNNDSKVTSFDARLINLYLASIITDFNIIPQETEGGGTTVSVYYDKDELLNKGEKITIIMVVPENSNFGTADIKLVYDDSYFTESEIAVSGSFTMEDFVSNDDTVKYTLVSVSALTEEEPIFLVELEAIKDINYVSEIPFEWDVTATDDDYNYVNVCVQEYWRPLEECDHSSVSGKTEDATCTKPGCYYDECDDCGEIVSEIVETTPALGHDFVDGACTICGILNTGISLTIVPDKTEIAVGETVTVEVVVSENSNLGTLGADFIYDETAFEVVSMTSSDLLINKVNPDYAPGTARYVGATRTSVSEGGMVFSVELRALKEGETGFRVYVLEAINASYADVYIETGDITVITVTNGPAIPDTDHTHTFGEWVADGNTKYRNCTKCGFEESQIVTENGSVEIEAEEQPDCNFDAEDIEENDDRYVLIEETIGDKGEILKAFDINLKNNDGVHVQPNGTVKVKLPLDWEKEGNYKVYRVNEDGTYVDVNAYREGSHMVFETDHFSVYVIVEEYNYDIVIKTPSRTTIRHKDGIILYAVVEGNAPDGWHIKWSFDNDNFEATAQENDNSLKIISHKNGYTKFTATLYDADEKVIGFHSIEMRSKAGFFDKIGSFFRSLFGRTTIYDA